MIDQVIALLTSGSPMVAFAIYLIWSNSRSEKRLDALNTQFTDRVNDLITENKAEVDGLRINHQTREDALRDRWQEVVSQLQTDREQMERTILRNTETTQQTVERLSIAIESLSTTLAQLSERVQRTDSKVDRLLDKR
jgi:hypothetical protein